MLVSLPITHGDSPPPANKSKTLYCWVQGITEYTYFPEPNGIISVLSRFRFRTAFCIPSAIA